MQSSLAAQDTANALRFPTELPRQNLRKLNIGRGKAFGWREKEADPTTSRAFQVQGQAASWRVRTPSESASTRMDYKAQSAQHRAWELRFGTLAQWRLGNEVCGLPEPHAKAEGEALLVRSSSTRVPGWPRGFSLPLRVFADGGSRMACLSKLRGEEGKGVDKEAGSAEAAGCFLLSARSLPASPRGKRWEGGGEGRGKVVTRVNQQPPTNPPPLRGARAPGLAPRARAPASSCLRRSYVNEGA